MSPKKKKQKLVQGSSSTSTSRSRTRSVSTSAPPPTKKSSKKRTVIKPDAEEEIDELLSDDAPSQPSQLATKEEEEQYQDVAPMWDGSTGSSQDVWVELPPHPKSKEDKLRFVKVRDLDKLKAKGKRKEQGYGDKVWLVDQEPADALPWHFTSDDLEAGEEEEVQVVAVRPKPRKSSRGKSKAPTSSVQDSETRQIRAASLLPNEGGAGLEDMFFDSHEVEEEGPLFFEGDSDDEDRMRNGTPLRNQPSQQRKVVKKEPTLGDRIAKPPPRSRSSTPRPSDRKRKSSTSDSEDKDKKKPKSSNKTKDDLRSELNEDAFARSTGARHKEEYRNKLAKFAEERRKAKIERGESVDSEEEERGNGKRKSTSSSSSDSDDTSDSDTSSSSGSSSEDFIVGDDQIEYDEGFVPTSSPPPPSSRPSSNLTKGKKFDRDSDGRIRLVPPSTHSSSGSVLALHGMGAAGGRKGLDELCLDWLEWAVARVLLTWSALSSGDRERLERNRAALKSRMRSTEESVGSVVMRRQFKWYLTQYPKVSAEALFSDEVERFGTLAKQGCGICHRRSQKPQFRVTFGGLRYNQTTLAPLKSRSESSSGSGSDSSSSSDESDSSTGSDRSDDTETWREEGVDERDRKTFSFYAGKACAQRAVVMHRLHHWEWATMQTLAKHESIWFVRRLMWRKGKEGRGKDGRMGAGAWEVAFCVGEMIAPSGRCVWGKARREKEKGKGKDKGGVSELDRLRKRLKALQDAAIEVNRAR